MEQELEKIGLTKAEAKVYIALLELGSTTTGPIVDRSGASSSKIYEILERLIRKGLVNYIVKGKTKYFQTSAPNRIMDYMDEKEEEIRKQKQDIEKIMPQLMMKKELSKHDQDTKIYKGFKGMETAFMEAQKTMSKGETYFVFGVPPRSKRANKFFLRFDKEREKRGIKMKILFNESAKGEGQTLSAHLLGEIKYMPEGIITPASINIFNNRTLIFPADTEKDPVVIEINNKEIADSFRAQFEILWNQTTRVYTGLEGPKLLLKDIVKNGKEILAMGVEAAQFRKYIPEDCIEFAKGMNNKKIPEKLIFKKGGEPAYHNYLEVRYLSEEQFSPLNVEIYGNKIVLIDWTHPITTIFIEKKSVADSYRKYFEVMWKIAKK